MSENALVKFIPEPVRKIIVRCTRKGRVDELDSLNNSLKRNTDLVAAEYNKLDGIEAQVATVIDRLTEETFEKENSEIDKMGSLPEEQREAFKKSLVEIRDKGLIELAPISETAQKIKAHMLITLNKAQVQKATLDAKAQLAKNAVLQVETLQVINKETKDINGELQKLLADLDKMNSDAITEYSDFASGLRGNKTEEDGTPGVIDHIVNKMVEVKDNQEKVVKAKEKSKE